MTRTEILQEIIGPLTGWYSINARPLPWREAPSPYHVWLSEIMLQQTRIEAVIPYYHRFLSAFPDIASLAAAEEDSVLKLWQGLGYYSRARNLHRAAGQIMTEHGGVFPDSYEKIKKLAGIGEYTAGAIASIAFGIPVPAVDGNVLRVLSRLLCDERDVLLPETKKAVTGELLEIMPKKEPGIFNEALMELGETVCLPNGIPLCQECPLRNDCLACKEGRESSLPVRTAKKTRRIEKRVVFLIRNGDRFVLHKREKKGLLAGLWELPGIEGEEPVLPKEWGFSVISLTKSIEARHIFTHLEWHMRLYIAETAADTLPDPESWVFTDKASLTESYALPSAFRAFLPLLP
ncbi:MAG: A/G-specific adenine glycosylase [Lachnospiraceae bacterium]|nr:A/G-specific adenine glycosylase [Lachnospiraceae bacterium]